MNVERERPQRIVRIALLQDADAVFLSTEGDYQITDARTSLAVKEGRRLAVTKITPQSGGIALEGQLLPTQRLEITSDKEIKLRLGKNIRRFRGRIDVIRDAHDRLLVVNRLGLEEYIRGVLYHETSDRWPMEALKVQAVASRTYALYQMKNNAAKEYDVTSDVYSQVYGGQSGERYRTNLAVQRTFGEILRYQGEILPAYFSATCGGTTEDAGELWNHHLAPLKGVSCGFCFQSPHYRWRRNFRLKDIQDQLNQNGYRLGLIKEIRVAERNKSGRVATLEIITRDGRATAIAGKDFRQIIGPNTVKSNSYRIVMKGYYFDLVGQGWGHGVGMCQWGAREMARKRYSYREILNFYYPGADIVDF